MDNATHKKVLASGIRYRFQNVYLYLLPLKKDPDSSQSFLSVSVTKKAYPKAVNRNQVKRKIIEYFRLNRTWINKFHIFVRVIKKKDTTPFDLLQFEKDIGSLEVFNAKN